MRKAIIIALALAGCLIALGCGGGGTKKTIDVGDGNKVSLGKDLPSSFPDDFPIYKGANLQGAVEGEQDQIKGIVATWTTGDSINDVKSYYDGAFGDGNWKTSAKGSAGGGSFWSVENKTTGKVGYVAINPGDTVSIIATVGDNPDKSASADTSSDGSSDTTDTPATSTDASGTSTGSSDASLPDAVQVPADFPKSSLPLPGDARVTVANSVTAGGTKAYTLSFYTKDSVESLGRFYKDALEGKGFTQTVQTSDASSVYAAYSQNPDGTGDVIVLTVGEGDVAGYRQGTLQLNRQ